MKALVVYESMWGNTQRVAEAIAAGLRESMEVELVEVNQAPAEPAPEVGLIVAGGPTHAFSMSRTRTRADAVNRGADHTASDLGLREWLDRLPPAIIPSALRRSTHGWTKCVICLGRPPRRRPRRPTATVFRAQSTLRASTSMTWRGRCLRGARASGGVGRQIATGPVAQRR